MISENKTTTVMLNSFIVNILLVFVKIIVGILGQSKALIVDGVHSLSDLATDVIAIIGGYLSRKPADEEHPFGHGKIEYVTSLMIGLVILFTGFIIIYQVAGSNPIKPQLIVINVTIFTIIFKFVLSKYLIKKGKQYKNNIITASGQESITDVYSSIVVLISVVITQFSNYNKYLIYADKIAGIIIGVFIIKVGFDIVKENISMTVGEQISELEYLEHINNIIMMHTDVLDVSMLTVLKYGPYFKMVADIGMSPSISLIQAHNTKDEIEQKLKQFDNKIYYIAINMYPIKVKLDKDNLK